MDGIDFEDTTFFYEEILKLWPEDRQDGYERTRMMVKEFKNLHTDSDKRVAHIVVTHGYFVTKFSQHFYGKTSYASYCAISGIQMNGRKANLILDNYSDHIISW